jgi:hypothetical protein
MYFYCPEINHYTLYLFLNGSYNLWANLNLLSYYFIDSPLLCANTLIFLTLSNGIFGVPNFSGKPFFGSSQSLLRFNYVFLYQSNVYFLKDSTNYNSLILSLSMSFLYHRDSRRNICFAIFVMSFSNIGILIYYSIVCMTSCFNL